jgi:hypothetical protein
MTIQTIVGENGRLPQLCRGGACPAVIVTEEGDVFVQGVLPDAGESGQLTAPAGEGFVKMKLATFERIAKQVLAS